MLLTLRFSGSELNFFGGSKEGERLEEFWFGRGFAWGNFEPGRDAPMLALAGLPKLVSRTIPVIGKSGLRLDFAIRTPTPRGDSSACFSLDSGCQNPRVEGWISS